MTEYIILLGALALVAVGVVRVFGSSVEATIAREGTSIASVDARDTSEESTRPSGSSHSSQPSSISGSSQPSLSSGRDAEPASGYAKTGDSSLASGDETAGTSSPWGVVFIAIGVAAALVLLLSILRSKPSAGD